MASATDNKTENEGGLAPFELLPNEMAEIPIKMAMANMHKPLQKYEFLVNVVAKISTRFMTLALNLMQELTVERPPRMRLENKRRWMVEYFKGDQGGNSIMGSPPGACYIKYLE